MKQFTTVEVVVRQTPGKGRAKWVTEIALFVGPVLVASKSIGGWYNKEQGLAEFLLNPTSFKEEVEGGRQLALALGKKKAA